MCKCRFFVHHMLLLSLTKSSMGPHADPGMAVGAMRSGMWEWLCFVCRIFLFIYFQNGVILCSLSVFY